MKLNAELVNKVSKDGKPYTCIVIHLTDGYDKVVFLTQAELALVKTTFSK